MRIIISGGGTGGHIYPAIAIADALKQRDATAEILFVGASGKMEMQMVPAAGYPIVGLPISGFQRTNIAQNIALPFKLIASLWKARKIINRFRPDVVVGTGGYASGPILYMAAKQKIPTLIQEQNAAVGLTNRLLANCVDTVCVAYASVAANFPAAKTVCTGNPVREGLARLADKREAAHTHFNLMAEKKCLLVLGGSLGANTINETVLLAIDQFLEAGLQIIWVTGRLYFEQVQAALTGQQRTALTVYPFIERIELAYAAADIVVSRAGALTISELCVAQKATIFVPSPNVTADHQTKNAAPLVANRSALMVRDSEAMQLVPQEVIRLLQREEEQQALQNNIAQWARPQATAAIVDEIGALVGEA
jgi:UDP-N-acetylglucosamine--N-acetylmuramyl-(pentapeptide) pyrophosphoryl-undecaprenol N-acetylglucosamine transferase